jgi:hypothetical protein
MDWQNKNNELILKLENNRNSLPVIFGLVASLSIYIIIYMFNIPVMAGRDKITTFNIAAPYIIIGFAFIFLIKAIYIIVSSWLDCDYIIHYLSNNTYDYNDSTAAQKGEFISRYKESAEKYSKQSINRLDIYKNGVTGSVLLLWSNYCHTFDSKSNCTPISIVLISIVIYGVLYLILHYKIDTRKNEEINQFSKWKQDFESKWENDKDM